ncbi:MAG: ADP-ribosylglycohydrolase family protein [Spirochaetaceae bacterium]|nr:ADP-ribosylglycohydrolase family protein [Spirochaetaceae bacterium]
MTAREEEVEHEDRFVGALLGGAVGDALGSFCEGWPRERILEVEDLMGHYRDLRRRGEVVRAGGAYTDDTQQALVLVESLLARGCVDPGDVAARLLRMWRAGELYGYGRAFREALERMASGVPWHQAASTDMPSNGTVMKIAPIGLWHWRSEDLLDADAAAVSRLTHKDPRAVAPAVAIAQVVRHLAAGGAPAVDEVVALAERSAGTVHAATGHLIGQVRRLLELPADDAYAELLEMPESRIRAGGQGIPSEAPVTAVVALEAFLRTPGEFDATVRRALTCGGDVDTFAAVAGNLSGACNGAQAIPDHLRAGLPAADHITRLARDLYRKSLLV